MKINEIVVPAMLSLTDYQGFLDNAKLQGGNSFELASVIANLGQVRVYNFATGEDGRVLLNTGIRVRGLAIGLNDEDLQYFTVHSAGFKL